MKGYIKWVLGGILIGCFFAFLFYHDINKEVVALTQNKNTLYLFQVGVFAQKDNAEAFATRFNSRLVYPDDDYYRVLICATTNEENKAKLDAYYRKQNLNFFIKKVLDQDLSDEFKKLEVLLSKTENEAAIDQVCQTTLETFLTYSK